MDAWLCHVRSVFKKGKVEEKWQFEELPVTFSGYFSKLQHKEKVKPLQLLEHFLFSVMRKQTH